MTLPHPCPEDKPDAMTDKTIASRWESLLSAEGLTKIRTTLLGSPSLRQELLKAGAFGDCVAVVVDDSNDQDFCAVAATTAAILIHSMARHDFSSSKSRLLCSFATRDYSASASYAGLTLLLEIILKEGDTSLRSIHSINLISGLLKYRMPYLKFVAQCLLGQAQDRPLRLPLISALCARCIVPSLEVESNISELVRSPAKAERLVAIELLGDCNLGNILPCFHAYPIHVMLLLEKVLRNTKSIKELLEWPLFQFYVLQGVNKYPAQAEYSVAALQLLTHLMDFDDELRLELLRQKRVINMIIFILDPSDRNKQAQIVACQFVKSLTRSVHSLRLLREQKLAENLVQLVKSASPDIVDAALGALCNLVLEFSPHHEKLLKSDLLKLTCQYLDSPIARLNALWLLHNATCLANSATISTVTRYLSDRSLSNLCSDDDPAIAEQALRVAQNLATNTELTPPVIRAVAGRCRPEYVSKHTEAGIAALDALANIAVTNSSYLISHPDVSCSLRTIFDGCQANSAIITAVGHVLCSLRSSNSHIPLIQIFSGLVDDDRIEISELARRLRH